MKKIDLNKWEKYFHHRELGTSVEASAKKAKLASSTAWRFERGDQSSTGLEAASILGVETLAGNLVNKPLTVEAQQALDDFAYFRMRYLGRRSAPWQERAAYDVIRALQTKDREYMVVNCPPGSGKSTLFTHDIPCWLIARDRSIRIQVGARTERQARMYAGRIRKTLERDAPMRAASDLFEQGLAFDAVATMQDDFGAFKPEGRSEMWRNEGFTVRQLDGVSLDDKEPTVSAWGQDSGFLGVRVDFVVWDDLVDSKNTKNIETKEGLEEWWSTEAETRLEPGGVLVLKGQRIRHNDLYRYALNQKDMEERPKYRHIIYQAHDDKNCRGHENDKEQRPAAWPDGCLLDPWRLPMKFLENVKYNNPRVYDVQYQQNDGELVNGLVEPEWLEGGVDSDGYKAPGCRDTQRPIGEVPEHLRGADGWGWSFVTVDPSPTEWWGVIWWVYDPTTGNRYVIDIIRRRMNPEQFLTMNLDSGEFSGLVEEIRFDAIRQSVPLSLIVVEVNAAQKWLLSQPHIQRWQKVTGIRFVGHTTGLNKNDPEFGLESIGDLFRQGKIRLPWSTPTSRLKVNHLTKEALTYPEGETTDLLMSTWFAKLAVDNLYQPKIYRAPSRETFSWMQNQQRGMAGWR